MNEEEKTLPSDYFDAILVWEKEIEGYQAQIAECHKKQSDIYEKLAEEHGRSFEFNGKWYSVKKFKKTGMFTLSEYDVPPGSWLKKEEK